jgi:charged multivesicular body protein 2A
VDRERATMEKQEKKLIADIKKAAKDGQTPALKIMARDLVRTRKNIQKFYNMRANIQGVSMKLAHLKSTASMASSMKGVTKAMQRMNKQINLPQFQKLIMEFEKQNEMMDMKEEMMSDAIDDVMGASDDEEETDAVLGQVLGELGLSIADGLNTVPDNSLNPTPTAVPGGKVAVPGGAGGGPTSSDIDADLEARLNNLRRDDGE